MAANLGTREMDYRFRMLITINHQVMHAANLGMLERVARFISVSSWWNCCSMLLCYWFASGRHTFRSANQLRILGQRLDRPQLLRPLRRLLGRCSGSSATVQQCDFEGIFLSICVPTFVHLFKNCEVSSSSPFRDFTPSRLEKVECFSFELQLHCTGTMKDACMLLRFMLQKMNRLNSNEMTFLKVEVEDGARLLIEKVLVSASAACGAKTLTASLELVQGYHYFESLALAQLLWWFSCAPFGQPTSLLEGWVLRISTKKHESIGSAVSQDRRTSKTRYVCVYIYIVTIVTILIHNYTS